MKVLAAAALAGLALSALPGTAAATALPAAATSEDRTAPTRGIVQDPVGKMTVTGPENLAAFFDGVVEASNLVLDVDPASLRISGNHVAFPLLVHVVSGGGRFVLDVIDTQTTAMATHVLPTKGQLERPDLPYYYDQFNLDFSTQYSPPFVPPRGESRSMWLIAAQLAKEVGVDILPAPLTTESSDDEVLATFVARSGSSFDQIKDARYVAHEPVFGWVTDRVLPDRRWRVAPHEFVTQMSTWTDLVPPPGLVVTSRRQHRHLNSQQPTGVSSDSDHSVAYIHPDSANHLGIGDGDLVEVVSANGSIRTRASINSDVHPDVVSVTHGLDDANVCELTTDDAVDELTGMVVQTALPVVVRLAPRQF